jgi:hypothetical protein
MRPREGKFLSFSWYSTRVASIDVQYDCLRLVFFCRSVTRFSSYLPERIWSVPISDHWLVLYLLIIGQARVETMTLYTPSCVCQILYMNFGNYIWILEMSIEWIPRGSSLLLAKPLHMCHWFSDKKSSNTSHTWVLSACWRILRVIGEMGVRPNVGRCGMQTLVLCSK